jgi:hypothetical protein
VAAQDRQRKGFNCHDHLIHIHRLSHPHSYWLSEWSLPTDSDGVIQLSSIDSTFMAQSISTHKHLRLHTMSSTKQLMRSHHPDKGLLELLPFWWTRYHKEYSWYARFLNPASSPLSCIAQSTKALLTALLTFTLHLSSSYIWKGRKASQLSSPFLALLHFLKL